MDVLPSRMTFDRVPIVEQALDDYLAGAADGPSPWNLRPPFVRAAA